MGKIFHWDSPLMRFMMLITNLICLNVLWLLCCLPVVTAGAATAAMYSVLFLYITKQDDGVLKPYFKAFKENFKSVTPAWILHLLIGIALRYCWIISLMKIGRIYGMPSWDIGNVRTAT